MRVLSKARGALATRATSRIESATRVARGDWQTPLSLAEQVVSLVGRRGPAPQSVLEPTCGDGAFLAAAARAFPGAELVGFDISPTHVARARARLCRVKARVEVGDFYHVDWHAVVARLADPILILGNPPWVTSAALGALDAGNLPTKSNFQKRPGFEAMTGKSNFDISEWMLLRLLTLVSGRSFVLAMLCKTSVARRMLEPVAAQPGRLTGEVFSVDARTHFAASVDAVLLRISSEARGRSSGTWPVYDSLSAAEPSAHMGVVEGKICSDVAAYERTLQLAGTSEIEWRSGIKHDCSKVVELEIRDRRLVNGLGQTVRVEHRFVYPLLKGSDVANQRLTPRRKLIVTQRQLGEDTSLLQSHAPLLWQYLQKHRDLFEARKSSIYREKPCFAIFGVGSYSFAPFKVAISGLYKRLCFVVVRPVAGRPVMLDDTAYFLPCTTHAQAEALANALNGDAARDFFQARIFWDAKRPISKALLQSLSLAALLRHAKPSAGDLAQALCRADELA